MTVQIGIVGSDGVLIASDRLWMNTENTQWLTLDTSSSPGFQPGSERQGFVEAAERYARPHTSRATLHPLGGICEAYTLVR
jgi:hypothetical protein